ncbi:DnaJ domain-containing protein [Haloarchaeobius iranensis]|uniref:DnaJ domain-containing protein n=1 Tax=Haloarchaeobius iranensis TaxID=996166 RepID=A0A1G9T737_9EURY|nr:DnaJ domain-containing protein [Haloarchaeobius iranensis]SDM43456.1 DnaJ domain-containing protein [Haloarchaeobius iranensis]
MTETFYDVLGVGTDATQDEITAAYRERVKETHPDLNDSADAADEFQRVAEAEEVLSDPDERARYDRLGHGTYQRMFGDAAGWGRPRDEDGTDEEQGRERATDDDRRSWAGDRYGNRNRRQEYPGSDREAASEGNRTSRSYYVGDNSGGGSGTGSGGGTTSASTDGGANAASSFEGAARRTTRGQGEHVAADEDDEWDGFSVHDWDEEELEQEPVRVSLSQQSMVLAALTFLMYPFLAYVTVSPQLNLFVNVIIGGCTLLLLGYLLTIPRVAVVGFGALSVGLPLVLAFVGVNLLAPMSVFLVGACVVPFWYAMAFKHVVG